MNIIKRLLVCTLICVSTVLSLQASDIYFSQTKGSDTNPGTESQPLLSRTKAYALWKSGDRIWETGFNFKLISRYDASDPYFGDKAAPIPLPSPLPVDLRFLLKSGASIKSVSLVRRKTNTSTQAICTINKDTKTDSVIQ